MAAILEQPSALAGLLPATPPGLPPLPPLLPDIAAAIELGPPPGLSPLPLSLAPPSPPGLGLCQSLLEEVADDKLTRRNLDRSGSMDSQCSTVDTRKLTRSGSVDLDSQCSTADTAEAAEEELAAPSAPKTLEEAGYEPGRILRSEASIRLSKPKRPLLSLADTIKEPQAEGGKPGYPSVGSAGHHLGLCKPCDFVHRGSCRTGFACKFCHLCGPEANKQKKKDRKKLLRTMRAQNATAEKTTQEGEDEEQSEEEAEEALPDDIFCGVCDDSCGDDAAEGSSGASRGFRAAVLGGA